MAETYFEVLGIPPTSDFGTISSAYLRKKAEYKSDPSRLCLIEDAYRVLMNPMSLRKYMDDLKPVETLKADNDNNIAGAKPLTSENKWPGQTGKHRGLGG